MSRKYILTTVLLLLIPLFAWMAFAEDEEPEIVTYDADSIRLGETLHFTIDLEKLREIEAGSFEINIHISPDSPVIDFGMNLDVKEDVNLSINKVSGDYSVVSADIRNYKTLTFSLRAGPDVTNEDLQEGIEYTVTVTVLGDVIIPEGEDGAEAADGETEDGELTEGEKYNYVCDFTFMLEPAEEDKDDSKDEEKDAPEKKEKDKDKDKDKEKEKDKDKDKEKEKKPSRGERDAGDDEGDDTYAYKGSSDNYLSELSVSGYDLTQNFHKTRSIYFVDTPQDVTSLDVTAVPCDRSARVDIAGSDNVGADYSKIIINVRAANGDLRTYTIYVRH